MKPVCVNCKLFYQAEKNGTYFEEGMPTDDTWKPYKLWCGDLWKCHGCGAKIIVGVPPDPLAEHFQSDYAETARRVQPILRVDDC